MRRTALAAVVAALTILGAPSVASAQSDDLADRLEAIPGMTVVEERDVADPFRFFVLSYTQPADHADPLAGSFEQRLTLLHRDTDHPMVLHTSGYNVRISASRSE